MIINLLYIIFVLSAFVLIVVILLQEGKGGGFGEALGGHGQATFGVGAKGINTFTGYTAGVFLVSAMLITIMHARESGSIAGDLGPAVTQPLDGGGASAPAGNSGGNAGGGEPAPAPGQ